VNAARFAAVQCRRRNTLSHPMPGV